MANCYSQFTEKHLAKIPSEFSKEYLITHEFSVGRRLSYKHFKAGKFITASEKEVNNFMNTMLLGSATYLYDYLKEKYPDFSPEVVKPNGFTTSVFCIKYKFNEEEILIIRTMNRNVLSSDPLAAEKPENYSLLYAFNFQNHNMQKEIENIIVIYCLKNNVKTEYFR